MAVAFRTGVPVRRAPARHRVSTLLDGPTLQLAREWADFRGTSLSTWMARAVDHCAKCEGWVRLWEEVGAERGEVMTEEDERRIDEELDQAGFGRIVPYAPSGPRHRVSLVLDEKGLTDARESAGFAGLSISGWLARTAWIFTQVEEGLLAQEERAAEFHRYMETLMEPSR